MTGAITPCGQCEPCLGGDRSQSGGPLGGWQLGNTIDGAQAEYVLIPHAQTNLAHVPDALSDEQVLLLADIASTGFSAAERGHIDTNRLKISKQFGATTILESGPHVVERIKEITKGRGVDTAIEALGLQETFGNALRVLRPGGTLSSVGVYSGHLKVPLEAFGAGLGDYTIVTTLCPGGKRGCTG